MKRILACWAVFAALVPALYAQELESPGIFILQNYADRDDFFGDSAVMPGNAARLIFILDDQLLSQISAETFAGWLRSGDITFANNQVTPRPNEVETGNRTENGKNVTYVSMIVGLRLLMGQPNISSRVEFRAAGKAWTLNNTTPLLLTPKKMNYLQVNLVSRPVYKERTTTVAIKIEGSANATITLERVDGADVLKNDLEASPKLVRNVLTGSLSLAGVIEGTYNLRVEQAGFEPFVSTNVHFSADAPVNISAPLQQQRVPVTFTVTDTKGKGMLEYDLIVRTQTEEDVQSRLALMSESVTLQLPPGTYRVFARKSGFGMQPKEITLTAGMPPQRMALIMTTVAAPSNQKISPIAVTINALDFKKGGKLTKFNIRIVKADGSDTQEFPMSNSGKKINLMPGSYTVTITKDGYDSGSQSIELVAGQRNREVNISISKTYKPKPSPSISKTRGGWGWLFLIASVGAAGYYVTTSGLNDSYGTPPAVPSN